MSREGGSQLGGVPGGLDSLGRFAPAGAGTDEGAGLNHSRCSQERERQELDSSLFVQSGAVVERMGVALGSSRVWCLDQRRMSDYGS